MQILSIYKHSVQNKFFLFVLIISPLIGIYEMSFQIAI